MDTNSNIVPILIGNKEEEEENSVVEMVVGKSSYSAQMKRKRESLTNPKSLPDEMVFEILARLPAEDIYNHAMLVCRNWYRTIRTRNFVYSHLRQSTPGLLVQTLCCGNSASYFVSMSRGRVVVSEFGYELRGGSWASCNGLIVEFDYWKDALHITNPAIKQHLSIPLFSCSVATHDCHCIAYSAASMEYKVVVAYRIKDGNSRVLRLAIRTVGVDQSWRHVCTEHLPNDIEANTPFVTEGFIHWPSRKTHVLTLNVETEVITETPVPRGYEKRYKYYLSTGKSLSFIINRSEFALEVWEMKSETREWTKMCNVDLEARKSKFEHLYCRNDSSPFMLVPGGWLNYKEALVLCVSHKTRVCIAYNLRTQEIGFFELGYDCKYLNFEVHTNSLVWFSRS